MKDKIIEINELSDSRELLETQEAPGIRWFIFALCIIIASFLIFSNFFNIDEYSKQQFEIKTDSVESNVKCMSTCKISNVYAHEGDYVNKGDVLYVLDAEYAETQKAMVENDLEKRKAEISNLYKLKESIEKDTNLFQNNEEESEYYYKFEQYKSGVLLTKDDIESAIKSNNASSAEKKSNIESARQDISENEKLINEYSVLLDCIENDKEYKGNDPTISSFYKNYKSEYEKGVSALKTAKADYKSYKSKYEEQNDQDTITPSQVQEAEKDMNTALGNMSSYMDSFILKINSIIQDLDSGSDSELINEYMRLIEKVKLDESFESSNKEVQSYYDDYLKNYSDYKKAYEEKCKNYNDLYDKYSSQSKMSAVTKNDVDKYKAVYDNAKSSLESIKTAMIYEINKKIQALGSEDESLKDSIDNLNHQLSGMKDYENNETLSVEKLKNDSIVEIESEINSLENSLTSYESQISDLEKTISDSNIIAVCSGRITLASDICEGDLIQAGASLCTIIPTDENLKACVYIYEKDIPGIEVGQKVEYCFDSLPIEEYGVISGKINKISADTLTDERSGIRYYTAEADFDKTSCKNKHGEERKLINGMLGEAKIISGKKTVFTWMLEKLNFID
ncbi:MAG: HlyD family efflux transporter periplasmic adaptor subunit [Eubacterium sp.]|nr:HlyD family efflux transporter periplasmic adaptor subunit [Eubacterium sp.]